MGATYASITTGRKRRTFSDEDREWVKKMSVACISVETICRVLKTDFETLRKYFGDILDETAVRANAAVINALFENCMKGDTTAQIFWAKTRLGWKETITIEQTNYVMMLPNQNQSVVEWEGQLAQTPKQLSSGSPNQDPKLT